MKDYYEIYIDEKKIGKSLTRNDAYEYINEEYSKMMPFLEYNPTGVGDIDVWENGILKIEIRRICNNNRCMDVIKILEAHLKSKKVVKEKTREIEEVNVQKVMPCTPRRTRIKKDDGKLVKGQDGQIIEKDGVKYISKKGKWSPYYENNYNKISTTKRKCPKTMAKEHKEGTVKKGLDGKMWVVKLMANGNKKWVKK